MSRKRDYYEVLGVARSAAPEEIKSAYRKLALKHHPDRNGGDAEAAARFKEAAEAYAVLSDPAKRRRYDQFGHAGVEAGAGGGGFSGMSMEDIFSQFSDIFGGGGFFSEIFGFGRADGRQGRARRGASLRVDLEVTLEEVASGATKTIEVARNRTCSSCRGSGAAEGSPPRACPACRGAGQVVHRQGFLALRQTCPQCRGAGSVVDHPCASCGGRGQVRSTGTLSVQVPPGMEDGHVERVHGEGEPGEGGGPPGDLLIVFHLQPHPSFQRSGDDLLCEVALSYTEAILGTQVEVPTLEGSVKLRVPAGSQPGQVLRVRSQGLPKAGGYGRGNLLVRVAVELPTRLDQKQRELLEELQGLEGRRRKKTPRKGFLDKVKDIFDGST